MAETEQKPQKLRYSLPECLEQLGVSRATFFRRVKAGKYKAIKDGGRTFMSHAQLINAAGGDGDGSSN